MVHDPWLRELLMQWDEGRKQGRAVSAEQLCQDRPELLGALKQGIEALEAQPTTTPEFFRPSAEESLPEPAPPLVSDDYQILREVGRGGMGIVYQAFDRKRQRTVALKTFQTIDPSTLYRFKLEFRALADVAHPNLVPLYELISDGRQWFFSMEFVEGMSFLEYVRGHEDPVPCPSTRPQGPTPSADPPPGLRTHRGLTPRQLDRLRDALRQLAEGTLALHEAGKLHRDIKPSNVLVTPEGRVLLLDFGLAADLQGAEVYRDAEEQAVGTAAYMAPEQAMCLPVSPASDWYSVGVMLFEALTGVRPFQGLRTQVLLDKQHLDAPAPSTLVAGVPEDLNALCVELLRRRPRDRPAGPDVVRRLRCEPAMSVPHPLPPRTPFVGREDHLAILEDAFRATRQGRAVSVYVRGRSGLGKSALVQRFLVSLQERHAAVVLGGRCYERESVPYKALDSLVDALSHYLAHLPEGEAVSLMPRDMRALARVFPVLRRVVAGVERPGRAPAETPDQQELRRRAFAALRELLTRLGARRPLVLFIDDLQWGDLDSALLLTELLRPPDPPVLLLLGCLRSEDATTSPFLRAFLEPQQQNETTLDRRELTVGELTAAEARQLALTLLGPGEEDTVPGSGPADAIARESRGNPFFLYELVKAFQAATEPAERRAAGAINLDQVLWTRIQRLPDEARKLLEVLAVAGRPLAQASAARAAGLEQEERALLSLLRTSHLVRGTGAGQHDPIETYHDRIRETVVARLPEPVLKERHEGLALTLEAAGHPDPETLAIHFLGAGHRDKAGHYYALAAEKAGEALAFDRAANLYRLAMQYRPATGADDRGLRQKLADALANAGRGAEAAREYQAAAVGAHDSEALELQRRVAYQYCISGHIDEGKAALATVLARVGLKMPPSRRRTLLSLVFGRARLGLRGLHHDERAATAIPPRELERIDVSWSAAIGLTMIDTIRGADFQTRNLLLALRAGEPYRLARALAWQATHVSTAGTPSARRVRQLLDAADRLAARIGHPHALGLVTLARGIAAYFQGRWPEARRFCDAAEAIFRDRCTGVVWEVVTAQSFAQWSLFFLGEVAELAARLPRQLQEARERGDRLAEASAANFGGTLA